MDKKNIKWKDDPDFRPCRTIFIRRSSADDFPRRGGTVEYYDLNNATPRAFQGLSI
jgi:hypothetical protein